MNKTVQQIADYKARLQEWLRGQKSAGWTGIILRGRTELGFLVEALARQEGLEYRREDAEGAAELEGWTGIFSPPRRRRSPGTQPPEPGGGLT